ncbi:hypothetical protein GTO10_00680, partial [Candidatus Saccharibacteria bacterium]|nr:hypothetical protein [Candidatus Saccharibacteria bacterium]
MGKGKSEKLIIGLKKEKWFKELPTDKQLDLMKGLSESIPKKITDTVMKSA